MSDDSNVAKGAAQEAVVSLNDNGSVKRATKQAAPKELWGRKLTRGERQCWAQGFNAAAPVAAAPTLDAELAQDRMSELCALERDVLDSLPAVYYMDPPDGGDVSLGEQVKRMAEDAALWRKHSSTPAAPGIELREFGVALIYAVDVLRSASGIANTKAAEKLERLIELIDASPKGGSDVLQIPDTEGVREILGRMCFQCIRLAEVLRLRGDEIGHRAEDEQAAVLRFLLNHYLASPEKWAEHAQAEIDAIRKQATSTEGEE